MGNPTIQHPPVSTSHCLAGQSQIKPGKMRFNVQVLDRDFCLFTRRWPLLDQLTCSCVFLHSTQWASWKKAGEKMVSQCRLKWTISTFVLVAKQLRYTEFTITPFDPAAGQKPLGSQKKEPKSQWKEKVDRKTNRVLVWQPWKTRFENTWQHQFLFIFSQEGRT